jgi:type IV secretion system T-DNA border endonuclease VirD2
MTRSGLAQDLLGEWELLHNRRRYAGVFRGTTPGQPGKSGRGGSWSRTERLTRMVGSTNSLILKKIARGGTHSAKQLGDQLDYLFSKSSALFGNMVDHDPEGRSLSAEERKAIAADWSDGWGRDAKNGQTTHLLLSFPADLKPQKALSIAEIWAAEMFQSGIHADDEWAYVAALHTDRPNPHVHIVVNNRGLMAGTWFYMARQHVFNLDRMKERAAEIAEEMGVTLDISSRIERGILTYGPSRAEIETAKREQRAVEERALEGKALEDALGEIAATQSTLRALASLATLTSLEALARKFTLAAEILARGGIITPERLEVDMELDTVRTRGDLRAAFTAWHEDAGKKISALAPQDRHEMRRELAQISGDILRDLGDAAGAELAVEPPRSALYGIGLDRDDAAAGVDGDGAGASGKRGQILETAEALGISRALMAERLGAPAANAWQEREWIRSDILAVAGARGLDLEDAGGRGATARLLDGFYEAAAQVLGQAVEASHELDDRLQRTLGIMAEAHRQHGKVSFAHDDHAGRLAEDLKARYGADVLGRIVEGDDSALSTDFPEAGQRRSVAQAILAAAESHETVGLSLREIKHAREQLQDGPAHEIRRRDSDLEL